MIRTVGRVVLLGLVTLSFISVYRFPDYTPFILSISLIFIALMWALKAVGELGLDSVRGQFYIVMAVAFAFQGIGFAMSHVKIGVALTSLALATYILARFFFFVANVRYVLYFQSLGYRLSLIRLLLVILLTLVLIGIAIFVPSVLEMFKNLSPYALFITLDVGMAFIIFYNLLLLWGSEIAKKWAMGSVAIGTYLLGDALFISQAPATYTVAMWILAFTMMGWIATIRG